MITHKPYGSYRFDPAGGTLNSHLHLPTLEGPHIGVGSFIGGGLFNHFLSPQEKDQDPAGELPSQPNAFDMAIGQDCRVLSLTRYSYRNLVSGRPRYDDVSPGSRSTPTLRRGAPAKARARWC